MREKMTKRSTFNTEDHQDHMNATKTPSSQEKWCNISP